MESNSINLHSVGRILKFVSTIESVIEDGELEVVKMKRSVMYLRANLNGFEAMVLDSDFVIYRNGKTNIQFRSMEVGHGRV